MTETEIASAIETNGQVELSHSRTFWYKYVHAPVIAAACTIGAVCLYRPTRSTAVLLIYFGASSVVAWLVSSLRLKRVTATADGLYVDKDIDGEHIPYTAITWVSQSRLGGPTVISVKVNGPYRYGPTVKFAAFRQIPPAQFKDHPVTAFLKSKIGEGRAPIG
jgi:uncharacterized membrane protein